MTVALRTGCLVLWLLANAAPALCADAAVPEWYSSMHVDPMVMPRSYSRLEGFEGQVEQCGEFVARYFVSQHRPYPTQGQPWVFLTTGRDDLGRRHPEFGRYFNGGAVPPRAGDVLVAKGARPGQFHTALVTRVGWSVVRVLQANVPLNWVGGRQVVGTYPLVVRAGRFSMPPIRLGVVRFGVVGWIR